MLQHLTGSKQHNVALREYAVRRGLHVSEYGIEDDETRRGTPCATEEEVYALLGLAYIEPELREGRGELQAALEHTLPELVTRGRPARRPALPHDALRRPQHARARWPRPRSARGYEYLAVTDHSASLGFGNDVQAGRAAAPGRAGPRARTRGSKGFAVLAGSEVNIQPDGSLDYDDEVLAELDWVVASVHTSFRMSEKA